MKGRLPTPNVIKLVTGNRGRRPVENGDGVQVPPSIPQAPEFLTVEARVEWDRITPLLYDFGLLTDIDLAMLAAYCQCYSRWRQAEMRIQSDAQQLDSGEGLVVKSPNGYPQISPWLVIANKAMEQCKAYAGEFGLSPAARARVKAMALQGDLFGGEGGDPLQRFLSAGKNVA